MGDNMPAKLRHSSSFIVVEHGLSKLANTTVQMYAFGLRSLHNIIVSALSI